MNDEHTPEIAEWLDKTPPEWWSDCDPRVIAVARRLYDTPGRHYHTWSHIVACLEQCLALHLLSPRTVFLALLFHDAIYVAAKADNEHESARVADETLLHHSRIGSDERKRISRMILLTAKHDVSDLALTEDEKKMLDVDLSILGAPWHDYHKYMQGVRKEWCPSVVSNAAFRVGRMEFLRSVLDQPHVFASDVFRDRFEGCARDNINKELALLAAEQPWVENVAARAYSAARTVRAAFRRSIRWHH